MEQVKLFTRGSLDNHDQLELEINRWLAVVNPSIISRHMSVSAGTNNLGNAYVNCTVAIFYDTEEK